MKKILSILLMPLIFLASCGNKQTGDDNTPVLRDTASLEKYLKENDKAILVDVRSPAEYEGGHIPNATLLPVENVAQKAEDVLKDKEAPIVVYCRSGSRSAKAAKLLRKAGYNTVIDFGSIKNWNGQLETGTADNAAIAS